MVSFFEPTTVPDAIYKADLTVAALRLPESRVVAGLLLAEADSKAWREAVVVNNMLQVRRSASALRVMSALRARLQTMCPELWSLVRDGDNKVATQAILRDLPDLTREDIRACLSFAADRERRVMRPSRQS